MSKYGIGQPVLRFEDPRLLRGQGRYINDVNLPGQAHAIFVRSPHAHAKIRSIKVDAAKAAPGVVAVYTGHDVKADGLRMPKANMPLKRRYVISRVHAQYMEPRGTLGTYDPGEDRMTLYADVQYPHRVRNMLAQNVFKVPESKMRVIAQDVGGGFGTKGWQYIEHRLTLWAARKLLRPVKWTCERSEAVMADEHGRDNVGEITLALDKDNKFTALKLEMLANIGAYVGSDRNLLSPFGMIGTVLGVYVIPKAYINVVGVLSNTNPTAPYRGAGRPEAIYLIERLIDDAARELGVDRVELRRKNMLPEQALPYQSPVGPFYDCGEFEKNMDMALKLADVPGFAARQAESRKHGKLG